MKILHVISYPRSGSTILGLALGQYSKTTFLGEVSAVITDTWEKPCGCSTHDPIMVLDCPVWKPILSKVENILRENDVWQYDKNGKRKRLGPEFLEKALKQKNQQLRGRELKVTEQILDTIYNDNSQFGNASIIIDTSKNLDYFRLLQNHFGKDHLSLTFIERP